MFSIVPFRDDTVHCCTYELNTQYTASPSFDGMAIDCPHDEFFDMPLTPGACNNSTGYDVREYVIYFLPCSTSYRRRVSTVAVAYP